jgi:hypothetical protein
MWIHTQASQLCLRWRMGCVVVSILIHGCGYNARPTQAPGLRHDMSGALVVFFCDTHARCVPVTERSETDTSTAKHRRSRSPATCRVSGKSTQAIPATCANRAAMSVDHLHNIDMREGKQKATAGHFHCATGPFPWHQSTVSVAQSPYGRQRQPPVGSAIVGFASTS